MTNALAVARKAPARRVAPYLAEALSELTAVTGRVESLDGLRAFAVGAVLLCHTTLAPAGFLGVDVFFALSGYLITSILLREHARAGGVALGRFYLRRSMRLMPPLLAMLAAVSVYDLAFRSHSLQADAIKALPAVIFYAGNWYQAAHGADSLDLWNHTWSLAVEEQFYLVWPLALIAALRFGKTAPAWLAGGLGIASLVWRMVLTHNGASDGRLRGTDATADLLMWGCLLAVVMAQYPQAVARVVRWLALPAVALLLIMTAWPDWSAHGMAVGISLASAATCALIAYAVGDPKALLNRALAWRPLVVVGRLSYAIYLWHVPVTMALVGHIHNRLVLSLAVAVVSVGAALASWVVIEYPMQLLKDRNLGRGQQPKTGAALATEPQL